MAWLFAHRKTVALLCMAGLALVVAIFWGGMSVDDILAYTSGAGSPLAAAIVIALFCLKPLAVFTPSTPLYLASGILFQPLTAIAVVYGGPVLEAVIGYALGRSLGYERASELMARNPKVARTLNFHRVNSAATCFLSRLLPIPFDLVSLLYGATGTRFGVFLVFSLLGNTPWLIPWSFAGDAVSNPLSREFLVPFGVCILISVVVFFLSWKLQKRKPTS